MEKYSMGAETVEAVEWNGKAWQASHILKEWFYPLARIGLKLYALEGEVEVQPGQMIIKRGRDLIVMSREEFERRCAAGKEKDPVREEIEQLTLDLKEHNRRYYEEAEPIISDEEYDARMKRLEEMEREHPELADPHSPTKEVE